MTRLVRSLAVLALFAALPACDAGTQSSDQKQTDQQETLLAEGTSAVGMPAIKNFRERRQLKDIYEMRDDNGLVTYTYLFAEMTGKLAFFCSSIGYGIPAATQYTAPEKPFRRNGYDALLALPQADPNGLFSPSSAEGTWVTCLGPDKQQHPVYVEPRVIVSPFKLD